jgi:ABC-2 type transport system ATP-binding protein
MDAAIQVKGLTKQFRGGVRALDDVTFDVPTGSLFGLLGPNGAGKTTLFSVAAGFLKATAGSVEILGIDARQVADLQGRVSMLPQDAAFQAAVPVIDQLVMFGRLTGYDEAEAERRASEALDVVGLGKIAERGSRTLSHGMMKRVALCQAFIGEPEVIFLDEPTAGLDPENARRMREVIRSMRQNKTVVLSSHNLREIQEICDHAAILHEGVLEICQSMEELTASSFLLRITLSDPLTAEAEADLLALEHVRALERTGERAFNLELDLPSAAEKDAVLKAVNRVLIGTHDLVPRSLNEGASLETRFLEITGGTYDGASGT